MMYQSTAPGSLMLFGEHAVLHGKQAICCAVDQRIHVTLKPRSDSTITIHSDALGDYQTDVNALKIESPFEFVLAAIGYYQNQYTTGFDLAIKSDFSSTLGLGSSAAVTVATIAVIAQWLPASLDNRSLFQIAKETIIRVQGRASGADVAAAVYGGINAYRMDPVVIESIATILPDLTLVYSGAKVPTKTVIQQVDNQQAQDPETYQQLFTDIDTCTQKAIKAIKNHDWVTVGQLMTQHQALQVSLGVSTPLLDELTHQLCQQSTLDGAKISGSGLGDCVVALGALPDHMFPLTAEQKSVGVQQIPIQIAQQGWAIP